LKESELSQILKKHEKWLNEEPDGERADLQGANLQGAYLQGAYLQGAYLQGAYLQRADLQRANLDYSCWPLWCGSMNVKVDKRIAQQLAAHFCVIDCDDPDYQKARALILEYAKGSHRAIDLGLAKGDHDAD